MYGIPGEDEYWERVRERLEAPSRYYEPEPVRDSLYLDDELDLLEEKYGCGMAELPEGDLLDLVEEKTGICADGARWDGRFECIEYTYEEAS